MQGGGKWAILLMFAVAIAATALAFWYRYQQGHEAAAFWGGENARLIKQAPQVFLARLLPISADSPQKAGENIRIGGQTYRVEDEREITSAKGLIHARHALVQDASFDFTAPPAAKPDWEYQLRFVEGTNGVTVAVDARNHRILLLAGQKQTSFKPIAPGLAALLQRQFDE